MGTDVRKACCVPLAFPACRFGPCPSSCSVSRERWWPPRVSSRSFQWCLVRGPRSHRAELWLGTWRSEGHPGSPDCFPSGHTGSRRRMPQPRATPSRIPSPRSDRGTSRNDAQRTAASNPSGPRESRVCTGLSKAGGLQPLPWC